MNDESGTGEPVTATVELTGDYEEIAEIMGRRGREYDQLGAISDDLEAVLRIVVRTGGATKSRIADELPPEMTADLDSDTVIHVLRVLEVYELVALDGNTWRPGPALARE